MFLLFQRHKGAGIQHNNKIEFYQKYIFFNYMLRNKAKQAGALK